MYFAFFLVNKDESSMNGETLCRLWQLYDCSQAYEELKDTSHKVYLFNIYNLIQECYYQTTFPPPLSLVERLVKGLILAGKYCCRRRTSTYRGGFNEDSFSKYNTVSHIGIQQSRHVTVIVLENRAHSAVSVLICGARIFCCVGSAYRY